MAVLALSLNACVAEPTVSPMDIAGTAQAAAFTMIAQTQAALPTGTTVPPTETPVLTPTLVVLADCFISFHFAAWRDFDEDGLWDASEPPMAGVKFSVPGGFAQVWGHPYLSQADGWLTMEAWSPGRCPEREITITAVPPEAYEPTTPTSISLSLSPVDSSYEARFGFRAVSR